MNMNKKNKILKKYKKKRKNRQKRFLKAEKSELTLKRRFSFGSMKDELSFDHINFHIDTIRKNSMETVLPTSSDLNTSFEYINGKCN